MYEGVSSKVEILGFQERLQNHYGNLGSLSSLFLQKAEREENQEHANMVLEEIKNSLKIEKGENPHNAQSFLRLFKSYSSRKGCELLATLDEVLSAEVIALPFRQEQQAAVA